MYYCKLTVGDTLIEFHNNWLGEESILVNGHLVSKKSSVMGTHHHFSIVEDGHPANYILTTKLLYGMTVAIDLRRNGIILHEDKVVPMGGRPRAPENKMKRAGIRKLREYDISGAMEDLKAALNFDAKDPEIHFHMACGYSILEDLINGYESLRLAVQYGLADTEVILTHDMLAFLRMHEAFEEFFASNYTKYDVDK